jgi:hypothetical protein
MKFAHTGSDQNAAGGILFGRPPQCQFVRSSPSEITKPEHDQACCCQLLITSATESPAGLSSVSTCISGFERNWPGS